MAKESPSGFNWAILSYHPIAFIRRECLYSSPMNSMYRLVALPMLTLAIGAQTVPNSQLLDRPAVGLSNYKDNWVPVVGVDGDSLIVTANGSPVVIEGRAGIALSVGDRYANGFVTISDVSSRDVPAINDPESAATNTDFKPTSVIFALDMESDIDVPNAYTLFVAVPHDQSPDAQPALAIIARQIGDLHAGKQIHLSFQLPKLGQDEGKEWTALVFAAGRQVRSTGMNQVLPAYFDGIESYRLRKRIAERVKKGADAPIAAFRQLPLGLPAVITAKYQGATVNVKLKVSADGRVVAAETVGLSDPKLSEAIQKGVAIWLFLPPVKNGAAVPASVIIPIKM